MKVSVEVKGRTQVFQGADRVQSAWESAPRVDALLSRWGDTV